jgi:PadR family transcriptional regulator, regulatory protein AphA
MTEPTTTSFAILTLLAIRPWSTYELAQQMQRSVGGMWPRAESVVYDEPKRLVRRGLATARKEYTGRRATTMYEITPEGRAALERWIVEPGGMPKLEFEALLKVAFADLGSLQGLRANLAAIRSHAEAQLVLVEEREQEYAATGGPYPERLPVIALGVRYFREQAEALRRWVEWAESATDGWTGVTADAGAAVPPDAFE